MLGIRLDGVDAGLDLPTGEESSTGVALLALDLSCSLSMAIGTTILHFPISPSVTGSPVVFLTYPGMTNPGE